MKNIVLFLVLQFSTLAFSQYGSLDSTFNPGSGANQTVFTTAIQADGKIIIGGEFTSYNGASRNHIARLNTDGSLDGAFNVGTGTDLNVLITSIQSDGKIIIGGDFTKYNGTAINRIARLNADGSLDTSFNVGIGADDAVQCASIQPDGKIIVAGKFKQFNGIGGSGIVRLNVDGSIDTSFNVGSGTNDNVLTVSIQTDGKIIIGGYFTSYNGTAINRIARLNTDGSIDGGFNVGLGADDVVYATSIQSDGKIIIAGKFVTYNGFTRKHIVRLNADGSLDNNFNIGAGTNNDVYTLLIQTDGKIIIGGYFTTYDSVPSNYLIRLNADGTIDNTFSVGAGTNNIVSTISIQTDGRVIIGGYFTGYNGTPINHIARLTNAVLPPKASPQILCTGATVADLVAQGTNLKWYTNPAGGVALAPSTILYSTTYYVSQTVGATESDRTSAAVTISSSVTPTFTQVAPICSGDVLLDLPLQSNEGISGGWSPVLNNTATTTYTFTPTDGSCSTTATMTITVNASPDIELTHDDTICSIGGDDTVQLNAGLNSGSQSDYTYQWSQDGAVLPSEQGYYLIASAAGVYTCLVTDIATACQKTRTDTVVTSLAPTIANVTVNDLTDNNTVTVIADGDNLYSMDYSNGPFQYSNVFQNVEPGIHTVYVTDQHGCGYDSKTIAVVGAPRFFTPNGDGYNDSWKLKGVNIVFNTISKVDIFDRSGKLIKELPHADTDGWDGTFNGYPLPSDDYWFTINTIHGREVKGHFSLKR